MSIGVTGQPSGTLVRRTSVSGTRQVIAEVVEVDQIAALGAKLKLHLLRDPGSAIAQSFFGRQRLQPARREPYVFATSNDRTGRA